MDSDDKEEVRFAKNFIGVIATKLKWDINSVINLIGILATDDQLNFIYQLWIEAFPEEETEE